MKQPTAIPAIASAPPAIAPTPVRQTELNEDLYRFLELYLKGQDRLQEGMKSLLDVKFGRQFGSLRDKVTSLSESIGKI